MTRTVILVRHGEVHNPEGVFYGQTIDIPLSVTGRHQIDSIGKQIKLLKLGISTIHASTLRRAVQTAEILSHHLDAAIVQHAELKDVHIPALVGKPVALRKEIHAKGRDEYGGVWVRRGNESRNDIVARMLGAFERIMNASAQTVPLIVSHGDPLTLLHYRLANPSGNIPVVGEVIRAGYGIYKGQGIVLEIDNNFKIIKKFPLISHDSGNY